MKDAAEPSEQATDDFVRRRDAIDRVATLRARAIRVALFARMVLRPDTPTRDAGAEAELLGVLDEQIAAMCHVREMLEDGDGSPEGNWISTLAAGMTEERQIVGKLVDVSSQVAAALRAGDRGLSGLLARHLELGRGGFFEAVTAICNALWSDIDRTRAAELARTQADAKAIGATLERMGRIGKHVRLVALNASVEAARAGEEGKGLAVIALEFKTLAEEIQRLAEAAEAHNQR